MQFWYPGRTNLPFIFWSAGRKGRSGRFQCEQLLRSAAAARNVINCMSRHDAERLLTSWPPRNRNGDELVGPLGDTPDVQHVVERLCAVCPQATTAPLSPQLYLQPDFFSCLTPGQPWFPRNRYKGSQVSTCLQVWNTLTQHNAVQCNLSLWSLECHIRRWFKPAAFEIDLRTQPTFTYYGNIDRHKSILSVYNRWKKHRSNTSNILWANKNNVHT